MATIAALMPADHGWVIDLGNAHQVETGPLDPDRLTAMVAQSYRALVVPPQQAFLISFVAGAAYESPNFKWFEARMADFAYVDRIVVAKSARGQGLARNLYEALFAHARQDGLSQIVCEVNADPPNPGSDQFHAALGFMPVGQALLPNGKTVTYLARSLHGQ